MFPKTFKSISLKRENNGAGNIRNAENNLEMNEKDIGIYQYIIIVSF